MHIKIKVTNDLPNKKHILSHVSYLYIYKEIKRVDLILMSQYLYWKV
jgi:hypothetical protein